MNDAPLLPVPYELVLSALLGAVPLGIVLLARRGRPEPRPHLSLVRLAAAYALTALVLALATLVDDLPMAFGILGAMLGLIGMGVGVAPLYAFLYTEAWLDAHPQVVRADTARWQRMALLLALACLVVAVLMALVGADVVLASTTSASGRWGGTHVLGLL